MLVGPALTAVAFPVPLMVATAVLEDDHIDWPVTLRCVPLLKIAVAVNCRRWPIGRDGLIGVTTIWLSAGEVTVMLVDPATPAVVAVTMVVPCATAVS